MLDFSVNYEYRKKLERMLRTFTPEQKDLFEDWFELASVAISSMAMEYKVAGYKEGIATAKKITANTRRRNLILQIGEKI